MDEWKRRAACRGADPELFFPPEGPGGAAVARRALAICRGCPVREACLQAATAGRPRERYGIWGGLLPEQRHARRLRAS